MKHATRQPTLKIGDRKLRWSWRYMTWQIMDRHTGEWRNTNPEMAKCYAAAGAPIDVMATEYDPHQTVLF